MRTAACPAVGEGGSALIKTVDAAEDPGVSQFKGEGIAQSDRPELTSVRIIISGSRSLGSSENFTYIEPIGDQLDGAMSTSRAAVDARCALND